MTYQTEEERIQKRKEALKKANRKYRQSQKYKQYKKEYDRVRKQKKDGGKIKPIEDI